MFPNRIVRNDCSRISVKQVGSALSGQPEADMAASNVGQRLLCRCSFPSMLAGPSRLPAAEPSRRRHASSFSARSASKKSSSKSSFDTHTAHARRVEVRILSPASIRPLLVLTEHQNFGIAAPFLKQARRNFHSSAARSAPKNPYQALGVNKTASASEIKKAYYQVCSTVEWQPQLPVLTNTVNVARKAISS